MKVTKKIIDRVTDICAGAGMYWHPVDEYFDFQDGQMECYGNMVQALEFSFGLGGSSRLCNPWRWGEMESPEGIAKIVCECLEYDA